MELLPIIYWTLVGFGILAIIVIISSYISFYLRKKMGHIPTTEVTRDERDKKVKITNPDKRPQQKKSHHPKVHTRSKYKDNETKGKKRTTSSNERSSGKLYKRPAQDDQRSRIEILNAPKEELKYYSNDTDPKRRKWN